MNRFAKGSTLDASVEQRVRLAEWIDTYLVRHRYAPTIRECAAYLGINVSSTHRHLEAMREAGMVAWVAGESRTLHTLEGWQS